MGHHSNQRFAEKVAHLPRPQPSWRQWVVTGGGLGFLRPAPGSWGTAGPAFVYFWSLYLGVRDPYLSLASLITALAASITLIRLGPWACAYFQKPDPGQVVIDEFAGFCITIAFVPYPARFPPTPLNLFIFTASLYILFRLTDTLKIPPARQLEYFPFGWGILLDDIAAGVQANLIAQLIVRYAF